MKFSVLIFFVFLISIFITFAFTDAMSHDTPAVIGGFAWHAPPDGSGFIVDGEFVPSHVHLSDTGSSYWDECIADTYNSDSHTYGSDCADKSVRPPTSVIQEASVSARSPPFVEFVFAPGWNVVDYSWPVESLTLQWSSDPLAVLLLRASGSFTLSLDFDHLTFQSSDWVFVYVESASTLLMSLAS